MLDRGVKQSSNIFGLRRKPAILAFFVNGRGNCHDNAAAESFFQLLKCERSRRKIYLSREDARTDVSDCMSLFCNRSEYGLSEGLASSMCRFGLSGVRVSTEVWSLQTSSRLQIRFRRTDKIILAQPANVVRRIAHHAVVVMHAEVGVVVFAIGHVRECVDE